MLPITHLLATISIVITAIFTAVYSHMGHQKRICLGVEDLNSIQVGGVKQGAGGMLHSGRSGTWVWKRSLSVA